MTSPTAIQSVLRREIQSRGPISFARFMEIALYCPNIGYYERAENVLGRQGDYYTSVSVGPLFGQLLAFQFAEWLEKLPGPVQIVEAGAHDGRLAHDILSTIKGDLSRLEYWIIEPSPNRQKWQQATLNEFAAKVRWFSDFPPAVDGVIFSNEVLDALPFQRFGWDAKAKAWFEWCVGEGPDWTRIPAQPPAGFDIPAELAAVLPDAYTLEVNSAAADWWQRAARSLNSGRLVAIDYLLTAEELLRPERVRGTARAYRGHHVTSDLLANPGEQDITAHVNVSYLRQVSELQTETVISQRAFLANIFHKAKRTDQLTQFNTLTHPEHLGEKFRVFVQHAAAGL